MAEKFDLSTSNFGDDGFVTTPTDDVEMTNITINDSDGRAHHILGFDYVSMLLGDMVVCGCGKSLDPHQIAMHTRDRQWIIVPARCCKKFRWYRGDEHD